MFATVEQNSGLAAFLKTEKKNLWTNASIWNLRLQSQKIEAGVAQACRVWHKLTPPPGVADWSYATRSQPAVHMPYIHSLLIIRHTFAAVGFPNELKTN
jgi:hypothetical protein